MKLSSEQLRHGFEHPINQTTTKAVVELAEYAGEEKLTINCTQLGDFQTPQFASAKEKKRILKEWCDHLRSRPTSFTELTFGTRVPQELFDALCHQRNLVKLYIKWGAYEDLSGIEQLGALQTLQIGSGARVRDILPLTKLSNLTALSVENFQRVHDYAPLAELEALRSLSIEGDFLGPQFITVDALDFLHAMPQLQYFRLFTARLKTKDYRPVLALRELEHLSLSADKEVKTLYEELVRLPHLKWGLLKEKPELFRESR